MAAWMQKTKQFLEQFIKFGIVGAINTVLSYAIYFIGIKIGVHYLIAQGLAFLITVFISYMLNGHFVFNKEGGSQFSFKDLFKVYVSYSFTSLFLSSALLFVEVDFLNIPAEIGPIINLVITIPINFILNKFWAYKKR